MSNREKLTQGINYKIVEKTKEQRGESGHTELRNAVLLGSRGTAGAAAAAARARNKWLLSLCYFLNLHHRLS